MNDAKLAEYTKSRLLNASVVVGYLRSLIAATNELEIEVIYAYTYVLYVDGQAEKRKLWLASQIH